MATLPSGREVNLATILSTIHDAPNQAHTTSSPKPTLAVAPDRTVAEALNVPRIWVRDMRVQFFGDHDRNAMTEVRKKDLDAAITLAKAATTRLLEMAGEAETLEQSLVAARKKLED